MKPLQAAATLAALSTLAFAAPSHAQAPKPAPAPAPAPTLGAAQPAAALPPGAFLPAPPPYAHWIVTYKHQGFGEDGSYEQAPKDKPMRAVLVRTIEYVKSPNAGKLVKTYSNGIKQEVWVYENLLLEQTPNDPQPTITDPSAGLYPGSINYDSFDMFFMDAYPGFDWIDERMFVGQAEAFGKKCYYFRKEGFVRDVPIDYVPTTGPAGTEAGPKGAAAPPATGRMFKKYGVPAREAWISIEGRVPVALRCGGETRTFTFTEAPSAGSFPSMPPALQQAIATYIKGGAPVGKRAKGKRRRPDPVQ
jgi:hypothetical protein